MFQFLYFKCSTGFKSSPWKREVPLSTASFDQLENVAIAMHCNLRSPNAAPVLIPFNYDAHAKFEAVQAICCGLIAFYSDSWPLTLNVCSIPVCRDQTLYQIWVQSKSNPRRSFCHFNIWPTDLELVSRIELGSGIIVTKFELGQAIHSRLIALICWRYVMSRCDLKSLWYTMCSKFFERNRTIPAWVVDNLANFWPLMSRCDLDIWPLTVNIFSIYCLCCGQTLFQIWAKSSNPRRSFRHFNIWPTDLELVSRIELGSGIIFTKFELGQAILCGLIALFWWRYVMSGCDLKSLWYTVCHVVIVCSEFFERNRTIPGWVVADLLQLCYNNNYVERCPRDCD